jgi:hypothetical protein
MIARDPRVRLAPQVAGAGATRLLEALDEVRPIVRVSADLHPSGASAAGALISMLVRLFPHTTIEGDARVELGPWSVSALQDLPAGFKQCIPSATRPFARDFQISVGVSGPANLYLGGDDWTMALGSCPQPISPCALGLGLQAGAIFATAHLLKEVLRPLGLAGVRFPETLIWNLLDYRLKASATTDALTWTPLSIALFGAGSVGSSAVGILAGLPSVKGRAVVVDRDTFDRERNPFRYPTARGDESGPKATWLSGLLESAGWSATPFVGTVADWVGAQPNPGFDGIAISSVDRVEGRLEVADALARTTLSVGVGGLALHLQRETLGDGNACPYCDFVDVGPTLGQVERFRHMTGLSLDRIAVLIGGEPLAAEDVGVAVNAGKVHPARAAELEGRRFDDLIGRVYAEAVVPSAQQSADVSIAAPFVSWMGGLFIVAELVKAAAGLAPIDRRVDVDLTGIPAGFTYKRAAVSARCVCASHVRRRWMHDLYAGRSVT